MRRVVVASYRRWLEEGHPAGSEPNLSSSIREAGQEPARAIALANDPEYENAYLRATNEARQKGIFGVPSFIVGDELLWGEDRLEDAIQWTQDGSLS